MVGVAPKMEFVIKEGGTGELMHWLETGAIDVALMATPTGHAALHEYPVFTEPFVAYLNQGHPMMNEPLYKLQPQDRPELLLLESEYCYNAQLLDICGLKEGGYKKERFVYEVNSIETLKNLVRAGLGLPWFRSFRYCMSLKTDFISHLKNLYQYAKLAWWWLIPLPVSCCLKT
jgi:LysR family hydrogen peroxide-inducible transcriptional activator